MERISIKDSQDYIKCCDDLNSEGVENAEYFTLTPKDGWEEVNYFTSRKSNIYNNIKQGYDSWVYVMSNPSLSDGTLKIGVTHGHPDVRAKELSTPTSIPEPFKVEYGFNCYGGDDLEKEVFKKLQKYRINPKREFFKISLEEAKKVIEELGERYN